MSVCMAGNGTSSSHPTLNLEAVSFARCYVVLPLNQALACRSANVAPPAGCESVCVNIKPKKKRRTEGWIPVTVCSCSFSGTLYCSTCFVVIWKPFLLHDVCKFTSQTCPEANDIATREKEIQKLICLATLSNVVLKLCKVAVLLHFPSTLTGHPHQTLQIFP